MRPILNKILLFSFLLSLLFVKPVFAQLDQRCWTEKECTGRRAEMEISATAKEIKEGFIANTETIEACGDEDLQGNKLGFCLPAGQAHTAISFNNQNTFTNIGDFIQKMYVYIIYIASGLAVVILIVSGFTWMASGGNQEKIGSSQKRIAGALMGLFLAIMAYSILDYINPYLLNLRLPQTWLINGSGLAPTFCDQLEPSAEVALYKNKPIINPSMTESEKLAASKKQISEFNKLTGGDYTVKSETPTLCGQEYFVKDTPALACKGTVCAKKGEMCLPFSVDGEGNKSDVGVCRKADLVLHYKISSFLQSILENMSFAGLVTLKAETDWLDDDIFEIYGICQQEKGTDYKISTYTVLNWDDNTKCYKIPKENDLSEYLCVLTGFDTILNSSHFQDTEEKKSGWWACQEGYKRVGLLLKNELGEDWAWTDINFVVGMLDGSQYAAVGPFGQGVDYNNFIPFEELSKGVYLDVILSDKTLLNVSNYKSTSPGNYSFSEDQKADFMNSVDPII
ncbi:MAG: pilin [Candidatus Magasanikiibacteriota bacterium]